MGSVNSQHVVVARNEQRSPELISLILHNDNTRTNSTVSPQYILVRRKNEKIFSYPVYNME